VTTIYSTTTITRRAHFRAEYTDICSRCCLLLIYISANRTIYIIMQIAQIVRFTRNIIVTFKFSS